MNELWDEKNSIEVNQNSLNNKELEINDITKNIKKDSTLNQCENIIIEKIHCSHCGVLKPRTFEYFPKTYNKNCKNCKTERVCKICRNIAFKKRIKTRIKNEPFFREYLREKNREYSRKNPDKIKLYHKRSKAKHGEKWKLKNREKNRLRDKVRNKKRWSNPLYKTSKTLSNKINSLIKDKNNQHVFDILGYSIQDLMNHLESKFKPGMTWENHGSIWHIDHIKPVSWFNFSSKNDPEFKECWALSNLQPLFVKENLSKGNKYIG